MKTSYFVTRVNADLLGHDQSPMTEVEEEWTELRFRSGLDTANAVMAIISRRNRMKGST